MSRGNGEGGQILVIFAMLIVVLLGGAALAIDVSSVYSTQRYERSLADAAALAGAQDAYREGTRTINNSEWTRARTNAMQNLVNQLVPGGSVPTCGGQPAPYAADILNCPIEGTPYYVSVLAPAPSCQAGGCDAIRSVQVTVRHPRFGLAFARLFGESEWNVAVTSVAERSIGTEYVFAALRPPKPERANRPSCAPNCDANEDNIRLDGQNTELIVSGDMGTNTNLILNAGATVTLDEGSVVNRYDAYKAWSGDPPDRQISMPIQDPDYPYPVRPRPSDPGYALYPNNASAQMSAAACRAEVARAPASYGLTPTAVDAGTTVCFKPGNYNDRLGGGNELSRVTVMLFSPGVYFFDKGMQPGNNVKVIGGYEPGQPGVAFHFPVTCNPSCDFSGNAATVILNAGSAYPSGTGTPAAAARNWDGTLVQTTGRVRLPITLFVARDANCYVAPTEPPGCRAGTRQPQLRLSGGGGIFMFGVTYAPTDNVFVSGNVSGSEGRLGQIWAWTFKYSGNARVYLSGVTSAEPGALRLATACSPSAPCVNPEAGAALP